MNTEALINIKDVSIKTNGKVIFEKLNLIIKKGENWAITGKETTLISLFLKIFLNNFNIASGSVDFCFFNDFIKQHQPEDPLFNPQKLIGMVPQKHGFKNLSNVQEFYYQQRYNAHDAENAPTVKEFLSGIPVSFSNYWNFEETVKILELDHLLDEHLIKLSNGETKRLLIAAALLKNPTLLLLDHPFTGLDVQMRENLRRILNQVAITGICIIIATTPYEIPECISNIAILENRLLRSVSREEYKAEHFYEEELNIITSKVPDFLDLPIKLQVEEFELIAALDDVVVRYDDKLILNNISWHIKPGERWALLGPNGAGKTTLLSLINGDNPQSYANRIVLFDRRRGTGETIWEIKSKIGFMSPELFQYFPLNFSCLKTVESGFYDSVGLYRKSEDKNVATALNWMVLLGINEYAEQPLYSVPANIQRLCLLARAFVKNPPLLLLDEPCQGLDLHQKTYIKQLINKICEAQNTTLVYVTHYKEEIPSCVSKLISLKNGEIIFKGNLTDYTNYSGFPQ